MCLGDEGKCGRLNLSMYGTRDAATNWEAAYQRQMEAMEFITGKASHCLFMNEARCIYTMVHGDDFFSVGRRKDVMWMKGEMERKFALRTTIVGKDEDLQKEVKVLNRKVKWQPRGISYEADVRHIPVLLKALNLEHARTLSSPATKIDDKKGNLSAEGELG